MRTSTGPESISEVFFQANRWWTETLSHGLLDSEVNSIEGWRVMGALRSGEGFTMSDISASMAIPPPTLTRIVDKLVEAGFVLRRVDAADRRRVLIYLSARGKTKVRRLFRQESLAKSALIDELGEDAAITLIRNLARVADVAR